MIHQTHLVRLYPSEFQPLRELISQSIIVFNKNSIQIGHCIKLEEVNANSLIPTGNYLYKKVVERITDKNIGVNKNYTILILSDWLELF